MNIITTNIIPANNDATWNPLPDTISNLPPKPVLVITNDMEIGGEEYTILMKMLNGCKLLPEQFNHIQVANEDQISWPQLHYKLNPFIVLILGVLPSRLGVSALFKINEPNHYDGTIWLPTIRVSDVVREDSFKKFLWQKGMWPLLVNKEEGELVCPPVGVKW